MMAHTVVLLTLFGFAVRFAPTASRTGIAAGAMVLTHPAPSIWLLPLVGAVLLLILGTILYRSLRATKWHLGIHIDKTERNDGAPDVDFNSPP